MENSWIDADVIVSETLGAPVGNIIASPDEAIESLVDKMNIHVLEGPALMLAELFAIHPNSKDITLLAPGGGDGDVVAVNMTASKFTRWERVTQGGGSGMEPLHESMYWWRTVDDTRGRFNGAPHRWALSAHVRITPREGVNNAWPVLTPSGKGIAIASLLGGGEVEFRGEIIAAYVEKSLRYRSMTLPWAASEKIPPTPKWHLRVPQAARSALAWAERTQDKNFVAWAREGLAGVTRPSEIQGFFDVRSRFREHQLTEGHHAMAAAWDEWKRSQQDLGALLERHVGNRVNASYWYDPPRRIRTLYATIGLPGVGKAAWVRDKFGPHAIPCMREELGTPAQQHAQITAAIRGGKDAVADVSLGDAADLAGLAELAPACGAKFVVVDFSGVPAPGPDDAMDHLDLLPAAVDAAWAGPWPVVVPDEVPTF